MYKKHAVLMELLIKFWRAFEKEILNVLPIQLRGVK
jgi:hypothetical protein